MPNKNKINILIVDDRPEGLLALEAVLDKSRYNVVKARSGEEALACVLNYEFGVILMDVQMPGMDGFETVKVIKQRERSREIPVIFLTAINKDVRNVLKGYESGAVDYVLKPFDPQILAAKVAILSELYLKNQQIREQSLKLQQIEERERSRQIATLQLESLNRYRQLADAIPHIIWKFRPDGTLEYSNRQWLSYSGLSAEESTGSGWQTAIHKDDVDKLLRMFEDGNNRRTGFEIEIRIRAATNEFHWHLLRAVPDLSLSNDVSSWVITNTDIEDRKKIEQDLIQAKDVSAAANQAKSAFLANMSHEIRTPLGIVLGYADLIANPDTPREKRAEYLSTIKRNGELLSGLIGDILDLSKIEAGHMTVEKVQFSLTDFLRSATQSFQNQVKEKNITLKTVLNSPIPVTILSDPLRLRQILFNIVSNAIKFTDEGSITICVEMESRDPGRETLKISVADQGIGITPDQAKRLFQPFIQADNSTTRRFGGTGLGLSLSRKLARQLSGDVYLASSHSGPKGSTFVITIGTGSLEGVEFTDSLEFKAQKSQRPKLNKELLSGVKVLVVEDAPENQFLLKNFLTGAGATVAAAENGQEGVKKALEDDFDVVLMDIQMPILDGYAATRELRKQNYKKPILALTAYALKEERARCLAAGCNDHLTKPINREDLLVHVAKFVKPDMSPYQDA